MGDFHFVGMDKKVNNEDVENKVKKVVINNLDDTEVDKLVKKVIAVGE